MELKPADDLFELYFRFNAKTEPPIIFHRWALIGILGAMLARQTWFPFGSGKILPNNYIMFVGEAGSRKSTAIKKASRLLEATGYDNFATKKTSKEQYLADLTGGGSEDTKDPLEFDVLATHSGIPVESFINADEFNIFMGPANLDFQDILGDMWDWDSEKRTWEYRLKNSKHVNIFQPTINILGGNTPTGFSECFPPASIGRGFLSRVLLVYGERSSRKITFPGAEDPEIFKQLLSHLMLMRQKVIGPMSMTGEAERALDAVYKSWPDLEDLRFQQYSTRRFTHLIKLCVIFAAARVSLRIEEIDVIRANTVLSYAETQMPKAMGELGKSRDSEAAQKVMQALYSAKRPKTQRELWPLVRMDLAKPADLGQILANLAIAEKIQQVNPTNGEVGYLPKQKIVSSRALYVDMNYLKGKEL